MIELTLYGVVEVALYCHQSQVPVKLAINSSSHASHSYGAFPLHGSARLGTVRLSSGRFAFPLQFSTAIEWAGLFTRRYNCAASTAVTSS